MQKIFNALAVLSFAMSGALAGGSYYAFIKLPELKQQAMD